MHIERKHRVAIVAGVIILFLCGIAFLSIHSKQESRKENSPPINPESYEKINSNRQAFYYFSDTKGVNPVLLFSKPVDKFPVISVDLLSDGNRVYEDAEIMSISGETMELHLERYIDGFNVVRLHIDEKNYVDISTGEYHILKFPVFLSGNVPPAMPDMHTSSVANKYEIKLNSLSDAADNIQYDVRFPDNLRQRVSYTIRHSDLKKYIITLEFHPDASIKSLDFDMFIVEKNAEGSNWISEIHVPFWNTDSKSS